MNLHTATDNALDLTRRLQAALHLDNMDLCTDLMDLRNQAMETFAAIHHGAGEAELAACDSLIDELIVADRDLQEQAQQNLLDAAGEFRTALSNAGKATSGAYRNEPDQVCIDRRA